MSPSCTIPIPGHAGAGIKRREVRDRTGRVRQQAQQAARGLADGAGRGGRLRSPDRSAAAGAGRHHSSTAATPTITTTSAAPSELKPKGIHYVDVGTSGGVWGLERGYCLMIGGENDGGAAPRSDLRIARARRRQSRRARPGATGEPAAPPSTATCTAARTARATS